MKNKTMKKAMITSIIALVLCFAMLVGTTYAWFTDSVTSANNIIKSGTLDISMQWADAKVAPDPDADIWTDASAGAIFNYDKWEPGYVDARHIQIKNEGTLALKYKLAIVANGDVSELADVIDVYFADPAVQVADRAALAGATRLGTLTEVLAGMGTTYGTNHLLAGQSVRITLALKMQESAGNEYQNKSIGTDFSVVLLATQYTAETDSFDNQYDANAQYPVASLDGAKAALASGKDVVLAGNVSTTLTSAADAIVVDGQTFDGNGKTLTLDSSNDVNNFVIQAKSGTVENVTIDGAWRGRGIGGNAAMTGDLEINNVTIDGPLYAINVGNGNGKNITVKDSEINGWSSIAGANTTFEDCTFGESNGYAVFAVHSTTTFINCEFCDGFDMFGRRPESPDGTTVGTLTLTNCTYNGTPVTAENFQALFDQDHDIDFNAFKTNENVSVIINGVDAQPYITVNQ